MSDQPKTSAAPLSIPGTALTAAAVGLLELAWTHRGAGPFQTGSPWAGVVAVALVHAVLGATLAVAARALSRLSVPHVGQASAALPLALAIPVAALLLDRQLATWAKPSMRATEVATVIVSCLVGVAMLARVLRGIPLLASKTLWITVTTALALYVGFQPQVSRPGPKHVEPRTSGPSVLLVTIDTLRADGVGAYGHEASSTPTLDALAADGVLYETAVAPCVLTGPSHMSILSGLLPMQHGVIENVQKLPHEVPTVPERVSAAGWDTAAFVSGYPVTENASALLGRFDEWDDDMRANARVPRMVWQLKVGKLALSVLDTQGIDPLPKWRKAKVVSDAAVEWLESDDDPFFAWVHYYDPHLPYEVPDELIPPGANSFEGPRGEDWYHLSPDQMKAVIEDEAAVARMRQFYDAEIALVDRELARVIAAARARAGGDSLWVLVTSDHGEAFGEHGIYFRRELYDASLRVPMILGTPADGPKGVRVSEQVRLTDVAATLLDILGLESDLAGEGVSLLPLARGSKSTLPGPSISAIYNSNADKYQRFLLGVRNDRWKMIWRTEGWGNSDALWAAEGRELYDVEADPRELEDMALQHPDLWESLRKVAGEVEMDMRSDRIPTKAELEALRALGYTN